MSSPLSYPIVRLQNERYEETGLTVSGLLTEKVPQSEDSNEYCMACDVRNVFIGVFWPFPHRALLDPVRECERWVRFRKAPLSLVFCTELRLYTHKHHNGYSVFHSPITKTAVTDNPMRPFCAQFEKLSAILG